MEHILRAAAAVTNEREFVVVGSQALLAAVPDLPEPLAQSMKLDLYSPSNPEAADLIDGTIGELSPFDGTFGYYAHGVGPETAVLPRDWRSRALVVENENTGGARGICPSPTDLALSKLAAGRDKDLRFVEAMVQLGLVSKGAMEALLCELEEEPRRLVRPRLDRMVESAPSRPFNP
ncbi:MAG: hypothetical protein GX548_00190 [Lentisphaerae bacterium]|nr:hypothetical protein [Lentisphaerota bacterium]